MRAFRSAQWIALGVLLLLPAPSQATPYTATFSDLNAKIIAGSIYSESGALFDIMNSTGSTWTDFHMAVGLGTAGTLGLATFGGYSGPGTATFSSSGSNPPSLPNEVDIVGLGIPDGGHYNFSMNLAAGESGWILAGYPTVGGTPPPSVPDAGSSLLLFGMALAGLRVWRKG